MVRGRDVMTRAEEQNGLTWLLNDYHPKWWSFEARNFSGSVLSLALDVRLRPSVSPDDGYNDSCHVCPEGHGLYTPVVCQDRL
jgi:hypothetical protein